MRIEKILTPEEISNLAKELADKEKDPLIKEKYLRMYKTNRRVPMKPARDFYEAIQAIWTIHALTPIMMRQRTGSIINISSIVGVLGNAGQCNYAAAKAGLIGLSKSMAKEMGPRGVRTNCIAPGFIDTEMTSSLPEAYAKEWAERVALKRHGKPEDIAGVALFLASELSAFVNGEVIECTGCIL